MVEQQPVIRIPGITELEKLELKKHVDQELVEFQSQSLEPSHHGELLTTTAIVVITIAAVKGITAWLLKTSYRRKIKRDIVIEYPDGRKETHTIELDLSHSQAPEAEIIKALSSALNIDPKLLSDA